MGRDLLIVTAADAKYFDLARGTILSIRDKPQGNQSLLAFFDLGCTAEQRRWLTSHVDFLREPKWEFDFPGRDKQPRHMHAYLIRPFLPKVFPGFEYYMWIDSDAWVQDWSAVELFLEGARRRGAAVVQEIDRGNKLQYGEISKCWNLFRDCYTYHFGKDIAKKFTFYPMINAGVVAIHRNAPHWREWARHLQAAMQKGRLAMGDQLALNLAVYDPALFPKTELLPGWCNWTCHFGLPDWDAKANCLVEPYLPHVPIGIVHLTQTKVERAKVRTTDGGTIEVGLRYEQKKHPSCDDAWSP